MHLFFYPYSSAACLHRRAQASSPKTFRHEHNLGACIIHVRVPNSLFLLIELEEQKRIVRGRNKTVSVRSIHYIPVARSGFIGKDREKSPKNSLDFSSTNFFLGGGGASDD